jgi:branched-chain amino acid transport system permease protein
METFLQQLANGLTIGSMFALVALGYTMVYGVMRLINFAHGDMVAASAFVGLTVYTQVLGQRTSLVAVVAIFLLTAGLMACVGVILERVAYRPLRTAPRLSAVVSALGASLVIQNGIMLIWGPRMRIFPELVPQQYWNFGGVVISLIQVLILVVSLVLMVALYLFIEKTRLGAAVRASSIDQDAARLMGINVNNIIALIFIIGSSLGLSVVFLSVCIIAVSPLIWDGSMAFTPLLRRSLAVLAIFPVPCWAGCCWVCSLHLSPAMSPAPGPMLSPSCC